MSHITDIFTEVFGRTTDVVAAAPGRANLIGEHVDYSGGFVLPFAIEQRTFAAICKRKDKRVNIASFQGHRLFSTTLDALKVDDRGGWERYPLGVLWALGLGGGIDTGIDLLIDSHVPIGAGLSSSAALECSVATAINHLFSLANSVEDLARLTQLAENAFVGVPCGIMDQSISLMAKENHAMFLDCRDNSKRHIPLSVSDYGIEILVTDTRAHHALMDGEYAKRRKSCDSVVTKLKIDTLRDLSLDSLEASRDLLTPLEFVRARHAVTEMGRVLMAVAALDANNFESVGQLLSQSHVSLRDDYTVSCSELNLAVETALDAGALGARMMGGGFGGSTIALVPAEHSKTIREAITEGFERSKYMRPQFYSAFPSAGARILNQC